MQRFWVFNNKVKQMNNKNYSEGETTSRQEGRRLEHSQTSDSQTQETHMM